MAKLGSCFLIVRNGASIKQVNGASGLPITRIETISNCVVDRNKFGYADIYDAGKYEEFLLRDQDILMSHINSEKHLGKVAIYHQNNDEKIIHGMNLLMLRANPEIVFPQYIAYYFESPFFKRQIVSITKKSVNQASFTVTALKELTVPIVSLDKQRKIAAVLDKVSELIAKRRAQLDKLDLLVKARFVEMFGNKNYCYQELISLIEDGAGLSYGIVQPGDDGTGDMGIIRPIDFIDGEIDIKSIKYIDRNIANGFRKTELTGKELLITVRGSTGSTALTDKRFCGMNVTRGVAVIRYDCDKINPVYLNEYLRTDESQRYIQEHTRGATLKQINLADLRIQQILVPPRLEQEEFAEFVVKINRIKTRLGISFEKLEMIKKALMQTYFG